MRSVPAGLATTIAQPSFRLATLVHIERADGTVYGYTNWDQPLRVDLLGEGVLRYSPARMEGISQFAAQINAPPDDAEISLLSHVAIDPDDIRKGFFADAVVTIGYVDPGEQVLIDEPGEGDEANVGDLLMLLFEDI